MCVLLLNRQVLVCAPSNIAVDQLTEKIHKTGLKVNMKLLFLYPFPLPYRNTLYLVSLDIIR